LADLTVYSTSGTTGNQFGSVTTSWATLPASVFATADETSFGTFNSSTNVWTAPSSGLPDGVLCLINLEGEDTSNGRCVMNFRLVNTSGTGTIVSAWAGGYCKDTSEDRLIANTWAFIDSPEASSTWTVEARRGSDAPAVGDEFVNGNVMFIPFYYNAIGMYTATPTSSFNGTSYVRAAGLSTQRESDTSAIESGATTTDKIDCKTDGARYLVLGGMFFDSASNTRTQRVVKIRRNATHKAMGVAFLRNSSNDINGTPVYDSFEGGASAISVDIGAYVGDGTAAREGGAEKNGSITPANSHLALVIIELNSNAEMIDTHSTSEQECALTGPVDLDLADTVNFNDAASFTKASASVINVEQDMDALVLANVNCPRNTNGITASSRWTARSHWTVNGTEQNRTRSGDYSRGLQSGTSTFGWSAHPAGALSLSSGDDLGVSVQELSGTEGGGGDIETEPFTGNGGLRFIAINLDTLAPSNDINVAAGVDALTLSEKQATIAHDINVSAAVDALTLTENASSITLNTDVAASTDALTLAERAASITYNKNVQASVDALTLSEKTASIAHDINIAASVDALTLATKQALVGFAYEVSASTDALTLTERSVTFVRNVEVFSGTDALSVSEKQATITYNKNVQASVDALTLATYRASLAASTEIAASTDALTLAEKQATITHNVEVNVGTDALTLTEYGASIGLDVNVNAAVDALTLREYQAVIADGTDADTWRRRRPRGHRRSLMRRNG